MVYGILKGLEESFKTNDSIQLQREDWDWGSDQNRFCLVLLCGFSNWRVVLMYYYSHFFLIYKIKKHEEKRARHSDRFGTKGEM